MSIMNKFAAQYFEKKNGGKVNESIIQLRNQDSISNATDNLCKEIEKILPDNVKYKGFNIVQNIERSNVIKNKNPDKKLKQNIVVISTKDTFCSSATFNFDIKTDVYRKNGEVIEEIGSPSMSINIPELFDYSNYLIKGNLYTPPIQVIESLVYTREDLVILKTSSKPLHFSRKKCFITDLDGRKCITHRYFITIGTKNIPFLLYYLAQYGFAKTLVYFGAEKDIKLFKINNLKLVDKRVTDKYYLFKFGLIYLGVDKVKFDDNISMRQFVACLIGIHKRQRSRIDEKYLSDTSRLRTLLGSFINENKAYDKGVDLLKSFNDLLDIKTKEIISKLVDEGDIRGRSMFSLIRYFFFNFTNLNSTITDMNYKRFRIDEYIISILVFSMHHKIFRFRNSKPKSKTLKKLQDIFKIDPNVLTNSLIGKVKNKKLSLDIVKFNNDVNDNSLLTSMTSCTLSGPGSIASASKRLSNTARGFDLTSLEKFDLNAYAGGDPSSTKFNIFSSIDESGVFHKSLFEMDDDEYDEYLRNGKRSIFRFK